MIRTMHYHHTTKTLKELIALNGLTIESIRNGIQKYSVTAYKTAINTASWDEEATLQWLIAHQCSAADLRYYNGLR